VRRFEVHGFHMGRLHEEDDLLAALTEKAAEADIRAGYVWALGTVSRAVLGFYNQEHKEYDELHYEEPLEIVSCHGNISEKAGDVALHLHMTVGDEFGQVYGGHVMPGNRVVVAEFCIAQFSGEPLRREHEEDLNLDLWPFSSLQG